MSEPNYSELQEIKLTVKPKLVVSEEPAQATDSVAARQETEQDSGPAVIGKGQAAVEFQSDAAESKDSRLYSASDEQLTALVKNPDSPEYYWEPACSELSRRSADCDSAQKSQNKRTNGGAQAIRWVVTGAMLLTIGFMAAISVSHLNNAGTPVFQKDVTPVTPAQRLESTTLEVAHIKTHHLQTKFGIQIANAIDKHQWNAKEAAEHLHTNPDLIGDLLRGKTDAIGFDDEIAMLIAMDNKPDFSDRWVEQESIDAISYYSRVLAIQPKNVEMYLARGEAYRRLWQTELALADYSHCLEIDPNNSHALDIRSGAYFQQKRYGDSIRDANHLIQLQPQSTAGYMRRGLAYQAQGNYDSAIKDFDRVIHMGSNVLAPYVCRAESLESRGLLKEAIADYEYILTVDPTDKLTKEKLESIKKRLFAVSASN
jgi:tetratricopeptide (TPR) repeat protein